MRIISGSRRGHKLHEFTGQDVRPTTDRVKESIFNLVQGYVPSSRVLDMYAGSGALSFEALSRGAAYAVLLDNDPKSIEIIRKNVSELGFYEMCQIRNISCFDYAKSTNDSFDVIFLDPPYNKGLIEPTLMAIAENNLLNPDGIIVLESDNTDFKSEFSGLEMIKQRRYGRTFITIYKNAQDRE